MVKCCVPLCLSCSNKTKGISYHEFPVNEDLKKKWVKNIPRQNWNPRETDRVCSLHFQTEDYKSGVKIKQLKPGVIPNVFTTPTPHNSSFSETGEATAQIGEQINDCSETSEEPSLILEVEESPGVAYLNRLRGSDCSFKVEKRIAKNAELISTKKQLKHEKNKNCRLERRVLQLKEQLEQTKNTLDQIQKSTFVGNLLQLTEAEEDDPSASFLMQQINTFKKKRVHWDKKMLKLCLEWRKKSPKGYEFPRQNKLLRLPNRLVLDRFENSLTSKSSNPTPKIETEEVIHLPTEIIILNGNEFQMAEDGITTIEIPEKFHDCVQQGFAETYIIHTTDQELEC